jgi:hypothetical protein
VVYVFQAAKPDAASRIRRAPVAGNRRSHGYISSRIQEADSVRPFASRSVTIVAASIGVAQGAFAQAASTPASTQTPQSPWSITVDVGGFVQGNRAAITSWLSRNAYGVAEPRHCGFDFFFRPACDDAVNYPQVSASGILAGLVSVRRKLSDRWGAEVLAATEQSGAVTGRCDDLASPKDARCTNRFKEVSFGGGSLALLGVVSVRNLHVGAGPALMLANWEMRPAHLPGVWVDATVDREAWPVFVRAQYRIYRSVTFAQAGFGGFHPSTLLVGLGVSIKPNNVGL